VHDECTRNTAVNNEDFDGTYQTVIWVCQTLEDATPPQIVVVYIPVTVESRQSLDRALDLRNIGLVGCKK